MPQSLRAIQDGPHWCRSDRDRRRCDRGQPRDYEARRVCGEILPRPSTRGELDAMATGSWRAMRNLACSSSDPASHLDQGPHLVRNKVIKNATHVDMTSNETACQSAFDSSPRSPRSHSLCVGRSWPDRGHQQTSSFTALIGDSAPRPCGCDDHLVNACSR